MMVKHEPLDVMKLFKPLAVAFVMTWWYPPADTGMNSSGSSWCFLDFLSYIPTAIGSYTHDLYEAEAAQITDKFTEVQELIHVRDTMYNDLAAQAEVAHKGVSDPSLVESTMEQTGVEQVTEMEKESASSGSRASRQALSSPRQDCHVSGTDCIQNRLVEYDLLPTDSSWNADDIRTDTVGIQLVAQMGKLLGKVADTLSDRPFLWCNVVLCRLLCVVTL